MPCTARLILEKDSVKKIVTCKHYGDHSCPTKINGRKRGIEELSEQFPRVTREGLIRQQVQHTLENGSYSDAVNEARSYSDVNYINNVRRKSSPERRPDGHSFVAIERLKKQFDKSDKFLIFNYNDGADNSMPYLIKSSERKVNCMINLNKEGSQRLSSETVYLDVLHIR